MPRSSHGGRHELGQNFLHHQPTIDLIVDIVRSTTGAILEIGAGGGALTRRLVDLGRPITAVEIDEHRAGRLRRSLPTVTVVTTDVLTHRVTSPVVVGNVPFHLTTPILRHVLRAGGWTDAILLVQWEVARKRAGVGGGTLMTAQAAPWFEFSLRGRVAASSFRPRPSVDGGILVVRRRDDPLVPVSQRAAYEEFAAAVFGGRGRTLSDVVARAGGVSGPSAHLALADLSVSPRALPRDLRPEEWAHLWAKVDRAASPAPRRSRRTRTDHGHRR